MSSHMSLAFLVAIICICAAADEFGGKLPRTTPETKPADSTVEIMQQSFTFTADRPTSCPGCAFSSNQFAELMCVFVETQGSSYTLHHQTTCIVIHK